MSQKREGRILETRGREARGECEDGRRGKGVERRLDSGNSIPHGGAHISRVSQEIC